MSYFCCSLLSVSWSVFLVVAVVVLRCSGEKEMPFSVRETLSGFVAVVEPLAVPLP
jgi:hypothetical protein